MDRVTALMYLSEVRDLVWGIRDALRALDIARQGWMENHRVASEEAISQPARFNRDRFNAALNASRDAQADAFLMVEALMSRWARLSLLVFPIVPKAAVGSWRDTRGQILRRLLVIPRDFLLSDREARDAWMHFDERMDQAAMAGRLGNRQQFVASSGVASALNICPRVIDMEAGVVHYRARDGDPAALSFAAMGAAMDAVDAGLTNAGERAMTLPVRAR